MADLISRQAAIDVLYKNYILGRGDLNEVLDHIVDRLEKLPSAQPVEKDINVPVKDCISRQEAIDYCYQLINVEHQQGSDEMNYGQERVNQTETILHHLEFMPSAQPEQRLSCKNCIHLGHGYMMPCKNCKRNQMLPDWYEVETERKKND